MNRMPISLVGQRNAYLRPDEQTTFPFIMEDGTNIPLSFENAFVIDSRDHFTGLNDCTYRIGNRQFTGLSFARAQVLEQLPYDFTLRMHEDGTKFLHLYEAIPAFDFSDRQFDSQSHIAIYAGGGMLNLIHCRCGYIVTSVRIFTGLKTIPQPFLPLISRLDFPVQTPPLSQSLPAALRKLFTRGA